MDAVSFGIAQITNGRKFGDITTNRMSYGPSLRANVRLEAGLPADVSGGYPRPVYLNEQIHPSLLARPYGLCKVESLYYIVKT